MVKDLEGKTYKEQLRSLGLSAWRRQRGPRGCLQLLHKGKRGRSLCGDSDRI